MSVRTTGAARAAFVAVIAVVVVVLEALLGSPAAAGGSTPAIEPPLFAPPWACGVAWHASTYPGHVGAGVDFNELADGSDDGAAVLASAPGTATVWATDRYGNVVDVDHGGGWITRYAHLAAPPVLVDREPARPGVQVERGDVIGAVGTTGNSNAPHLHYEQRRNDVGRPVTFDGRPIATGTTYEATGDPLVRSTNCDPGSEGRVYRIEADGTLRWTDRLDPVGGSVREVATVVGTGWARFRTVVGGGDGVLYGIDADGTLRWYRHLDPVGGTPQWQATRFGAVIGAGWTRFRHVVSGGAGVLYAVEPDGRLTWWRHLGAPDGSTTWAVGSGTVIGNGFDRCVRLFGDGAGSLSCIRADGTLQWWRHGVVGPVAAWQGGTVIGDGWLQPTLLWSSGNGLHFGVDATGTLRRYRYLGSRTGTATWFVDDFGLAVGAGWDGTVAVVPIR